MSNMLRFPAKHPIMAIIAVSLVGLYAASSGPSVRDIACSMLGCSMSVESAQQSVLPLLQRKFGAPPLGQYGFTVKDTRLIHKQGNEYTGIVDLMTRSGDVQQIPVDVMYDGKTVMYTLSDSAVSTIAGDVFSQALKNATEQGAPGQ